MGSNLLCMTGCISHRECQVGTCIGTAYLKDNVTLEAAAEVGHLRPHTVESSQLNPHACQAWMQQTTHRWLCKKPAIATMAGPDVGITPCVDLEGGHCSTSIMQQL